MLTNNVFTKGFSGISIRHIVTVFHCILPAALLLLANTSFAGDFDFSLDNGTEGDIVSSGENYLKIFLIFYLLVCIVTSLVIALRANLRERYWYVIPIIFISAYFAPDTYIYFKDRNEKKFSKIKSGPAEASVHFNLQNRIVSITASGITFS